MRSITLPNSLIPLNSYPNCLLQPSISKLKLITPPPTLHLLSTSPAPTMADHKIYRASTTAPVNIAVIKYALPAFALHNPPTLRENPPLTLRPPLTDTGANATQPSTSL